MALTSDEQAIQTRLDSELTVARPIFDLLDRYYDGAQQLKQLGLAIPPELARFTVVVNWPRVVVDAIADRLDVKGFRLAGAETGDEDLWALWQANQMDEQDMLAHLDYLVFGRTYKCVGVNAQDPRNPLITVESPRELITDRDPRTGQVRAAYRASSRNEAGEVEVRTLYLPNVTIWQTLRDGVWVEDRDEHGLGVVPVVPTFRRRRTTIPQHRRLQGTSAMDDVIPITDSAARNLTNAQVAQETHAVPARGVLGATKGDFVDQNGKPLPQWEAYFGSVWALANKDAKTFQFDSSDMANFERMHNLYARSASGVSGLPPNYFGLAADDAASADAIRSREARLVKIAERDQVALGNSDEQVLRIAARIRDGVWSDDMVGMETLWYDAGTPTVAQRTDAVVKLYAAVDTMGRPLVPREMAMEELGWGPTKIARAKQLLADEERDAMRDPYLERQNEKGAQDGAAGAAAVGA